MSASPKDITDEEKVQGSYEENEGKSLDIHKTNKGGIILIPQPSDDPRDPLNWSMAKKIRILLLVSSACMAATLSALANSSGFEPQAVLYKKTLTELSYSLSAAISGMAVGPFIWIPIAKLRRVGRPCAIAWSLVFVLFLNLWSVYMTGSGDYIPFVLSRMFSAIAGCGAMIMGGDIIVEIFFLHERGRAFGVYTTFMLFGTVASGTFSGFIVESADWRVQFWYNIGFEALLIVLCVLFLDETGWTRDQAEVYPTLPDNKIKRRLVSYFFAGSVMPEKSSREILASAVSTLGVLVSPVTLFAGVYLLISFGWTVAKQTMLAVYLQTPVEAGGYGFSPKGNAYFTFSNWVGIIFAQVYSTLANDRLPLWICKRFGNGVWKPEYRLHAGLWLPTVVCVPVGLGIFGACLQYHLHYMLLAFASALITFGGVTSAPVAVNYIVESFRHMPNESVAVMNFWRTALGIVVPFFVSPWFAQVGSAWAFGMMAFFTLAADLLVVALLIWGHTIREYSFVRRHDSDEGLRIIE